MTGSFYYWNSIVFETTSNWKTCNYLQVTRKGRGTALNIPRGQKGTSSTEGYEQMAGKELSWFLLVLSRVLTMYYLPSSPRKPHYSARPAGWKTSSAQWLAGLKSHFSTRRFVWNWTGCLFSMCLNSLAGEMWMHIGRTSWSGYADSTSAKSLGRAGAHSKCSISNSQYHHPNHRRPWN